MERSHVREIAVHDPQLWGRTLTLPELIRRGNAAGPRTEGQPLDHWIGVVNAGRTTGDLVGEDPTDDVLDPWGGEMSDYDAMTQTLFCLTRDLGVLLFPHSAE